VIVAYFFFGGTRLVMLVNLRIDGWSFAECSEDLVKRSKRGQRIGMVLVVTMLPRKRTTD
jgi:hypothetical protein